MDLSQFGASGAVVVVVLLFLKYMKTEGEKRDLTYADVAKALASITAATNRNTAATASADQYLRERNGRDNEFHNEVMVSLKDIPAQIKATAKLTAAELVKLNARSVKSQTVQSQTVEHQTIQE